MKIVRVRAKTGVRRVVVIGVLAAAAATAAGAFAHFEQQIAKIPPASASSGEVLRAYLAAAKNHECLITEELTVSDGDERSLAWCGGRTSSFFSSHPDLLAYKNIGAATVGPTYGTRGPIERCYPVDITETNMTGADPGVMPGWQFCFTKRAAGWRLADEGYG